MLALEAGDAETGSHLNLLTVERKFVVPQLLEDAPDKEFNALPLGVGEDQQELFAPDAAADVRAAQIGLQDLPHSLENCIACFVAVGVVHTLEIIQVGERQIN